MADHENAPLKSGSDVEDNGNKNNEPTPNQDIPDPQPNGVENNSPSNAEEVQLQPTEKKDYAEQAGIMCNKWYYWFPIGVFGWIGGWVLIICSIIDMIIAPLTFTQFFVIGFLICGGVLIIFVEMPSFCLKRGKSGKRNFFRRIQLTIYEWLKLLSRLWGRGVFNFVLIIMCYSEIDNANGEFRSLPWIAGIYLIILMVLYIVFSKLAARKYNALYSIIADTKINNDDIVDINISVDDQKDKDKLIEVDDNEQNIKILERKFIQRFNDIATGDNKTKITPADIANLAKVSGGMELKLSNSEKTGIFTFLDKNCDGDLVLDDWVTMWIGNPKLNWL